MNEIDKNGFVFVPKFLFCHIKVVAIICNKVLCLNDGHFGRFSAGVFQLQCVPYL